MTDTLLENALEKLIEVGKELGYVRAEKRLIAEENEQLKDALNKLKNKKAVIHKRVSKKNPFRVLRGGKSC